MSKRYEELKYKHRSDCEAYCRGELSCDCGALPTDRYCARCRTMDAEPGKNHCAYCLQLPPEDFAKPITQDEQEGLRW